MKCRYSENDIALFVEGDLSTAQAAEIEAHLPGCAACLELASEVRESQSMFKRLRSEVVSPAALTSVRTRVMAEIGAVRPAWGRWVYAFASGLFVLAIAVGWYEFRSYKTPEIVQIVPPRPPEPALSVAPEVAPVIPASITPEPVRVKTRRDSPRVAAAHRESPDGTVSSRSPKQLVVKMLTDDPDIVIYWLVDQTGGSL